MKGSYISFIIMGNPGNSFLTFFNLGKLLKLFVKKRTWKRKWAGSFFHPPNKIAHVKEIYVQTQVLLTNYLCNLIWSQEQLSVISVTCVFLYWLIQIIISNTQLGNFIGFQCHQLQWYESTDPHWDGGDSKHNAKPWSHPYLYLVSVKLFFWNY